MASPTENPLAIGLGKTLAPQPCALVIFGGAGDLARRKLLPALYNLRLDGVLPANFAVVGFARTEHTDESYRTLARESVEKYSRRSIDEAQWTDFERGVFYVRGKFDDAAGYAALQQRLTDIDRQCGISGSRVYYL
jgi:glucose-6-phosphate 1-dehydrogenase